MRLILFLITALAMPASVLAQGTKPDDCDVIKHTLAFLDQHKLIRHELDDEFCRRWIETLTNTLDPRKLYFLEKDIEEFRTYTEKLPAMAKNGDNEFCMLVFKRYQERVASAFAFIDKSLDEDFDFSKDEEFNLDPPSWPGSAQDRNERLRQQTKFDLLVEKSGGSDLDDARQFVRALYQAIAAQAEALDDQKKIGIYFDSYFRSMDAHAGYLTRGHYSNLFGDLLKEYRINATYRMDHRRYYLTSVNSKKTDWLEKNQYLKCELLAIVAKRGQVYAVREIEPWSMDNLIRFELGKDDWVTLACYDHYSMRRFNVRCPRR